MRTTKGRTIRRRRRRSYRRSLGDDEFNGLNDMGIDDFGIDDFSEDEFLGDEDDLVGQLDLTSFNYSTDIKS